MYIAIDLKSFYASVECVFRNLDPMKTNLVVADESRTSKTICLAVSPALKSFGVPGRPRLFEVESIVSKINADRKFSAPGKKFIAKSVFADEIRASSSLELSYIVAKPRMVEYMKYSSKIYGIYLRYIAPEDIHVYSIDEVFIDVSKYEKLYNCSAKELATRLMKAVFDETGITATAGVGTNLYLCKVAMDIVAKHAEPDENGARIAELDEMSYRRLLWEHRPITDFWRVGRGTAATLEKYGIYTMGDVARCSVGGVNDAYNEELLFKLFGINAELLIDHAWGFENAEISEIKAYVPQSNSISSGQVLSMPYTFDKAKLVLCEMAESVALDLLAKGVTTDQIVLTVCYDRIQNWDEINPKEISSDYYGRTVPKNAHGTINIGSYTDSVKLITQKADELFERIVDKLFFVRRIYVVANHIIPFESAEMLKQHRQLSLFEDYEAAEEEEKGEQRERSINKAVLSIKSKFGKNAIMKGISLEEGATAKERNEQVGGHKA